MKKHFSYLIVASALYVAGLSPSASAQSLEEKVAMAEIQTQPININLASSDELQRLPGIGARKAEAIVAFRERNGDFASLEQLAQVKGIGLKMVGKLAGKATVN